jgi:transcription elongation factor Elf1
MKLETYNKQLRPYDKCRSSSVEIVKNENAVGVMCGNCGNFFAFDEPSMPLSEVVEWWNNHYGQD